jgi:hypothetical protein
MGEFWRGRYYRLRFTRSSAQLMAYYFSLNNCRSELYYGKKARSRKRLIARA